MLYSCLYLAQDCVYNKNIREAGPGAGMGADGKIGRQLIIGKQTYSPRRFDQAGDVGAQRGSLIRMSWVFLRSGTPEMTWPSEREGAEAEVFVW